jgi:hypothetical protein
MEKRGSLTNEKYKENKKKRVLQLDIYLLFHHILEERKGGNNDK